MGLTKAQLEFRKTGIGASEAPALFNATKWAGPIDVYEAKVSGVTKQETLKMFLGNELEDPCAKLYARERPGLTLVRSSTLRHPRVDVILATPDRLVYRGKVNKRKPPPVKDAERLLQVKTTGWRDREAYGDPGTDQVPVDKVIQTTQEMMVTEVHLTDLAVLFDRDAFEIYCIRFDAELSEGISEVCQRFWRDHVVPRRPPPPDASERYREVLGRLYPAHTTDVLLPGSPEAEAWLQEWFELEAAIKGKQEDLAALKNRICAFIGEAPGIALRWGRIQWKQNKPSRKTDWEALARDLHTKAVLLREALLREAENYRDGDAYQPHGVALHASADVVAPLAQMIEAFTSEIPGNRPLTKYPWPKDQKKKALKAANTNPEPEVTAP